MWQITLFELNEDKIKPTKSYNSPSGTVHYLCGICSVPVGIYGPKTHHERGWILKRECCKNGHVVDWEGVE